MKILLVCFICSIAFGALAEDNKPHKSALYHESMDEERRNQKECVKEVKKNNKRAKGKEDFKFGVVLSPQVCHVFALKNMGLSYSEAVGYVDGLYKGRGQKLEKLRDKRDNIIGHMWKVVPQD